MHYQQTSSMPSKIVLSLICNAMVKIITQLNFFLTQLLVKSKVFKALIFYALNHNLLFSKHVSMIDLINLPLACLCHLTLNYTR